MNVTRTKQTFHTRIDLTSNVRGSMIDQDSQTIIRGSVFVESLQFEHCCDIPWSKVMITLAAGSRDISLYSQMSAGLLTGPRQGPTPSNRPNSH